VDSRGLDRGSWIYNYICDQCLYSLTLWVRIPIRPGVLDTILCDKVCQWLATGLWFSPGTPVPSTNKTDRHDVPKILLKVALSTITLTSTTFCINIYGVIVSVLSSGVEGRWFYSRWCHITNYLLGICWFSAEQARLRVTGSKDSWLARNTFFSETTCLSENSCCLNTGDWLVIYIFFFNETTCPSWGQLFENWCFARES
jgi:hypothetical protein